MNRLLQGDVGSGKTIVAVIAMIAAMENDLQTALMAPTEILAEQHARNIKRLLAKTPYRVELLTGSLRAAEKRHLQNALKEGEIHACIGTQALIQEGVAFAKLGLVVIDEQHRFGVMQRAELRARGLQSRRARDDRDADSTFARDDGLRRSRRFDHRRAAARTDADRDDRVWRRSASGSETIDHARSESGTAGLRRLPARRRVREDGSQRCDAPLRVLARHGFSRLSVGLLHGKMKPAEKEKVMSAFVAGEIKILVSTTVIEVGVDVPNASVMIVEHAERFGLSQLHQLRGRVGRGAEKSYCVLLTSDKKTVNAEERLGIMAQTSNGFIIAEKDLELRGPGELLGTKQSGLPEFRIGNIVRDQEILEKAKQEAGFYLAKEKSVVTAKMIARIKQDPRFGLAAIG